MNQIIEHQKEAFIVTTSKIDAKNRMIYVVKALEIFCERKKFQEGEITP